MSTICKLNANVRTQRFDRAAVIKVLRGVRGRDAPKAWVLAALLDKIRKLPYLDGNQKNVTFTRVLREARDAGVPLQ